MIILEGIEDNEDKMQIDATSYLEVQALQDKMY